jgi:hypothetical protein
MTRDSQHDNAPSENRNAKREPMLGVTAMIRSNGGIVVEGVVQDVSDGGIGISGDAAGLQSGDKVEVVLVIQGEKIGYVGLVRHMDAPGRFYGIQFESGPLRADPKRENTKQCKSCKKDSPDDHKFCFRCGQRLVGGQHSATRSEPMQKVLSITPS